MPDPGADPEGRPELRLLVQSREHLSWASAIAKKAIRQFGAAMVTLSGAADQLSTVEGIDGHPLIQAEGIEPADADAWLGELMRLLQLLPVWKAIHLNRRGSLPGSLAAAIWGTEAEAGHDRDGEDDEFEPL